MDLKPETWALSYYPQLAILGMTAGHFLQLCSFHFVRETSLARHQMSYNMAAAMSSPHSHVIRLAQSSRQLVITYIFCDPNKRHVTFLN